MAETRLGPNEVSPADRWVLVDLVSGRVVRSGRLPQAADAFGWGVVRFPPDTDDRVALMGWKGVQVLDLTTGRPVAGRVAAHAGAYAAGDFTRDGSTIVTGAGSDNDFHGDGRVVLWDASDGSVLDVAEIEPGAMIAPRMLPDRHTVMAATADAIYHWDTRIEKALEAACRAAGRSMTDVEWRTNVGDDIPYHATCG